MQNLLGSGQQDRIVCAHGEAAYADWWVSMSQSERAQDEVVLLPLTTR